MNRINKSAQFRVKRADAAADIALVNQYSVKELKPEDVYCFSVVLCDNDADRDNERFTNEALEALAPLFLGKTGISDHCWSADRQIARLYRVETEATDRKNAFGETLVVLRGSAYMLRSEANQPVIDAIEGGILKEVSVGCAMRRCTCSICGEPFGMDPRTWLAACANGHVKGETVDGALCVGNLDDPADAYEWSFVAVPAQRGAGVTKGARDIGAALDLLAEADLSDYGGRIGALMPKFRKAVAGETERKERAKILKENKKFIGKGE